MPAGQKRKLENDAEYAKILESWKQLEHKISEKFDPFGVGEYPVDTLASKNYPGLEFKLYTKRYLMISGNPDKAEMFGKIDLTGKKAPPTRTELFDTLRNFLRDFPDIVEHFSGNREEKIILCEEIYNDEEPNIVKTTFNSLGQ